MLRRQRCPSAIEEIADAVYQERRILAVVCQAACWSNSGRRKTPEQRRHQPRPMRPLNLKLVVFKKYLEGLRYRGSEAIIDIEIHALAVLAERSAMLIWTKQGRFFKSLKS